MVFPDGQRTYWDQYTASLISVSAQQNAGKPDLPSSSDCDSDRSYCGRGAHLVLCWMSLAREGARQRTRPYRSDTAPVGQNDLTTTHESHSVR